MGRLIQEAESGGATVDYAYDAAGNRSSMAPGSADTNPFRYCGEYLDLETGSYYLRARYYDPALGRFTQADTHWNTANMIYGDNPQTVNQRQDALGLTSYTHVPQITAVAQSGNLYMYCVNNPVQYKDENGEWVHIAIGAGLGFLAGGLTNLVSQLVYNRSLDFSSVDWIEVGISAAGGAIGGGLTAAGLGLVAAAVVSGGTNAAIQLHSVKWDFSQIDVGSVLYSAALGAIGAKVGGSAGNTAHLDSMGNACIKRIGCALSGKAFTSAEAMKTAGKEITKTLSYYCSQTSKDNMKVIISVIKSYLPGMIDLGFDFSKFI